MWSISEFYTHWSISGIAEDLILCISWLSKVLGLGHQTVPPECEFSRICDILKFWHIGLSVTISKMVQVEIYVQWKANCKSYTAYQMAPTPVTLNDLGRSFTGCRAFQMQWIPRTFLQHFTWFQIIQCIAWSLQQLGFLSNVICVAFKDWYRSWLSCLSPS